MREAHRSGRHVVAAAVAVVLLSASWLAPAAVRAGGAAARTAPRFYDDDPLMKAVETQDASRAQPRDLSLVYDASINLFGRPGLQIVGRAESINTVDEVPDSSWYTNRAGTRPVTVDEMMRGPSDDTGPVRGRWTVSRKSNGVSPG
jgi:hypothetical protein